MPSLPYSCSLTPLQSKFVASLLATTVLVLVLFFVSFPKSAYSFDGGASVRLVGVQLNGPFAAGLGGAGDCIEGEEGSGGGGDGGGIWEGLGVGELRGRDNEIVRGLGNGVPGRYNMRFGETNYWLLEPNDLFAYEATDVKRATTRDVLQRRNNDEGNGKVRRQDERSKELYITFNTCLQPQPNQDLPESERPTGPPPALQVYVSNTTENQSPGPTVTDKPQTEIPIIGGYGNLTINATGSTWIGIYAPNVDDSEQWEEIWNYEIVLSTTRPYHNYIDDQFLYLVDSDNSAALLITGNMTSTSSADGGVDEDYEEDELMSRPPPYTMYAQNTGVQSRFDGLERSYCAVTKLAQVRPGSLDVSMTRRGLGNLPKEQFHLKELNNSSTYLGFLTRPGSDGSDGSDTSGTLWRAMSINTKSDGNCQLIYNLPFCSEVAYAVPSNPTLFGMERLMTFYDDIAVGWYKNFSYSLQQVQCTASKTSAYSLSRNCTDCDLAYKNWLCAVTIPRCMDYSSPLPYLASRAASELFYNSTSDSLQQHPFTAPLSPEQIEEHENTTMHGVSSRNKMIDSIVRPGPYKEIKPCQDLCWALVQSCPSSFGFACPQPGSWGWERSYGVRDGEGDVTCSYLGAVYFLSAGERLRGWWGGGGMGMFWAVGMGVWFLWWEGV